jgi:uncharacterized protein involved in exopolysaccharide biosynthesis
MNDPLLQQMELDDEQEFHLLDYLKIIRKRIGIIAVVFVLVVLVTVIRNYTAVPIYSASTEVLIERNYGTRGLEQDYYRYEPDFLETQSALIKSVNVGRRVVRELDLTGRYRNLIMPDRKDEHPSISARIKDTVKGWGAGVLSFFSSAEKATATVSDASLENMPFGGYADS